MTRLVKAIAATAVFVAGTNVFGQSAMPFKLGTFEQNGRSFVGVVLKDAIVVDLAQASAALKAPASKVAAPTDMKDLIARYDAGVRARIGEVLANTKPLEGAGRPSFVHDLKSLKTLPPITYPTTMLNVAVNYRAHAVEPVHVLQVSDDRDCQRRGDTPSGRPHQHRLGVRAWSGPRPHSRPCAD